MVDRFICTCSIRCRCEDESPVIQSVKDSNHLSGDLDVDVRLVVRFLLAVDKNSVYFDGCSRSSHLSRVNAKLSEDCIKEIVSSAKLFIEDYVKRECFK